MPVTFDATDPDFETRLPGPAERQARGEPRYRRDRRRHHRRCARPRRRGRDRDDRALRPGDAHAGDLRFTEAEIDALVAQVPTRSAQRWNWRPSASAPTTPGRCRRTSWTEESGAELGWRWGPVSAAGLYVPGGLASYPSSVLMNAVPAKVAGVERLAITVPTPDGVANPLVLLAARIAGVDEIYRVGGAQAIAALAYGTESIAPVDKITGPGNAFVAAAKRRVFGKVGIDMIAGPSEILVIADKGQNPDWIALDMLSQAEHDESAQAILVTDDAGLARGGRRRRKAPSRDAGAARHRRGELARFRRHHHGARPRDRGRPRRPHRARAP